MTKIYVLRGLPPLWKPLCVAIGTAVTLTAAAYIVPAYIGMPVFVQAMALGLWFAITIPAVWSFIDTSPWHEIQSPLTPDEAAWGLYYLAQVRRSIPMKEIPKAVRVYTQAVAQEKARKNGGVTPDPTMVHEIKQAQGEEHEPANLNT